MLTIVLQSNLLHCNNWWSAFSLSALASLVALIGIIQKFRPIQKLEQTIAFEKESRQVHILYLCPFYLPL
jgi:nucleoside recognition membrane protein YjiH